MLQLWIPFILYHHAWMYTTILDNLNYINSNARLSTLWNTLIMWTSCTLADVHISTGKGLYKKHWYTVQLITIMKLTRLKGNAFERYLQLGSNNQLLLWVANLFVNLDLDHVDCEWNLERVPGGDRNTIPNVVRTWSIIKSWENMFGSSPVKFHVRSVFLVDGISSCISWDTLV